MSGSPSNVVRLAQHVPRQAKMTAAALVSLQLDCPEQRDDLRLLETLSSHLATLKASLAREVANYSQACAAIGQPDAQAWLSTLQTRVETLEAGMHRLAGAMTANQPR